MPRVRMLLPKRWLLPEEQAILREALDAYFRDYCPEEKSPEERRLNVAAMFGDHGSSAALPPAADDAPAKPAPRRRKAVADAR